MNNLRERKSCVSQKEGLSAKLDELAGEPAAGFARPSDRSAGVHARGYKGAIIRSVFVVDHTRTIRYRYLSEDPAQLPDVEEVLEAVREVVEAEYH